MAFVAFLDTCVLYPVTVRDVLLTIAESGVCQIRWSPDVLDEMERNIAQRPHAPSSAAAGASYLRKTMERAFPDAMVSRNLYHRLIDSMPNHPKDRHVLAAAIVSQADVLVTSNIRDFQIDPAQFSIDVQDPDTFLTYQFELSPESFFPTLETLASERQPPMNTVEGILTSLRIVTPIFAKQALAFRNNR
jgi:predicted nucleic acid-binding protein